MTTATRERPILFSGPMVQAILAGRKTQTRRVVNPQPGPAAGIAKFEDRFACHGLTADIPDELRRTFYCPHGMPGEHLWVREAFTYWERRETDKELKPGESRDYTKKGFAKLCERLRHEGEDYLVYLADGTKRSLGEWQHPHEIYDHCVGRFGKKISPVHMPRWASRITLELTGVRVERLGDISGRDAKAEGCEPDWDAFHEATEAMEGWEEPEDFIPECEEECDYVNYGRGLVHSSEHKEWLRDREHYALRLAFRRLWDDINARRGYSWESNPWVWVLEFKRFDTFGQK